MIIIIITNTVPIAPDIIRTILEPLAVLVLGCIIFDGVTIDLLVDPVILTVEVPVVVSVDELVVADGLVYDDESVLEADTVTVTIYHN